MKHAKTIIITFIFLGIIALSMNYIFGATTITFVQKGTIQGTNLTWYKYDTLNYLRNLEIVFTNPPDFIMELPSRQWADGTHFTEWEKLNNLGNNLAVILDYVIFIINVLLYPLRLGGYLGRLIFTLIGADVINPSGSLSGLIQFINALSSLAIPYI